MCLSWGQAGKQAAYRLNWRSLVFALCTSTCQEDYGEIYSRLRTKHDYQMNGNVLSTCQCNPIHHLATLGTSIEKRLDAGI